MKSPTSSSTPTDATPAPSRARSKTTSSVRRPRPKPGLRELRVDLGERGYDLRIGAGLLRDPAHFASLRGRPLRLITDANVAPLYLATLLETLAVDREQVFVLPAGETQKTWANAERVLDWLLASRLPRDGALLALGGGVVGDLSGFVASIYQRGVDFVQLPTTLLSQVDSSVGGKTGVNHARGKNLIGAFHQPTLVLADTDVLKTLPARELSAGLAEVIKCGLLGDAALFARLERDVDAILALDAGSLGEAIERCCRLKARIVALDERESITGGPRTLLNLGHTFGHAVETYTKYETWLHGEAVGLGLCMAADLSSRRHKVAIHSYVLMDNHLHLLATPETDKGLPLMMQAVGRRYVQTFNKRHGRTGTLWEGRYRATLVQQDRYLLACMVYIDLNPVRAGLVAKAADYRWSSHDHYIGARIDPLVTPHELLWQLGNTPFAREAAYLQLVTAGLDSGRQTELTDSVLKGWALGDREFITGLQLKTTRRLVKAKAGRRPSRPRI
ncbi:MAG: hypothetical protein NVS9B10_17700 [Nevskia sp.]